MKKHKILLMMTAVVMIVNLLLPCSAAVAEIKTDVVLTMQIDNPVMYVNGVGEEIDPGRGTKPVIQNGRTLVPIRAIIEAFDGSVLWDEYANAVHLFMGTDSITLKIGSTNAYLNNVMYSLDVAPQIIDGRTMLPVRFVAEGFNIGVAWDAGTSTIALVRDTFEKNEYEYLKALIPQYRGNAVEVINNNKPFFESYEFISGSFEYYSNLDDYGRCNTCIANVGTDIMPTESRESISLVKPTGWINKNYDHIDGGYLYNRCHLIGFQLAGENANEKNLITGTRYLNIEGMLPLENKIDDYVEKTGNHVLYRVTPVFDGDNLLSGGVLMEAFSVEDGGTGISFCVFAYNVQPGVNIDYSSGASSLGEIVPVIIRYYRTPSGSRYHTDLQCGGKTAYEITKEQAIEDGLTPCLKCAT